MRELVDVQILTKFIAKARSLHTAVTKLCGDTIERLLLQLLDMIFTPIQA